MRLTDGQEEDLRSQRRDLGHWAVERFSFSSFCGRCIIPSLHLEASIRFGLASRPALLSRVIHRDVIKEGFMPRRFKFPNTKSCKPEHPAVLCTAERLLGLYNQDSGDSAKRIAKKVRVWFAKKALKKGWAGVHFIPEIQSAHGAGCVLWLPPEQINLTITVTNELVLKAQNE